MLEGFTNVVSNDSGDVMLIPPREWALFSSTIEGPVDAGDSSE
jgi:hypothetical protein